MYENSAFDAKMVGEADQFQKKIILRISRYAHETSQCLFIYL